MTDLLDRDETIADRVERESWDRDRLKGEVVRLHELINHPHNDDWFEGVRIEAAHQQERWGSEHDAGKSPADWFWLLGYLAGKCLAACIACDFEKAKHHTISSAAALLNWHRHITKPGRMRPGIEEPKT